MPKKILVALLIVLGTLGYTYYYWQNHPVFSENVDSYESCLAAKGSRIQESYPATCVTQSGARFIQPVPIDGNTPLVEPKATPDSTYTLYNDASVGISPMIITGIYMVAKGNEAQTISNWYEKLDYTLAQTKKFYEREFPGMVVETSTYAELINGDLGADQYTTTNILPEIFAKNPHLKTWQATGSEHKMVVVYIDGIRGTNEGGYGQNIVGKYVINPAFWLDDDAVRPKDPYGLIGTMHELGHAVGIPHPWESSENNPYNPNYGNVPGDVMAYQNNNLPLEKIHFTTTVKNKMTAK